MTIRTETLRYEADGLSFESPFRWDDGLDGPRPGLLLFPDVFGMGAEINRRADQLAGMGYAVLACDLHGGGRLVTDPGEIPALVGPWREDTARIRGRTGAALGALLSRGEVDRGRIAANGYCFGGTMALELARGGAPLAATIGFHSGLQTQAPQDAAAIQGKVLVCIGADDPSIPPEQRAAFEAEMRDGKVDWQLHLYGGVVHSFTKPDADKLGRPDFARYDADADARSWAAMTLLLDQIFGAGAGR